MTPEWSVICSTPNFFLLTRFDHHFFFSVFFSPSPTLLCYSSVTLLLLTSFPVCSPLGRCPMTVTAWSFWPVVCSIIHWDSMDVMPSGSVFSPNEWLNGWFLLFPLPLSHPFLSLYYYFFSESIDPSSSNLFGSFHDASPWFLFHTCWLVFFLSLGFFFSFFFFSLIFSSWYCHYLSFWNIYLYHISILFFSPSIPISSLVNQVSQSYYSPPSGPLHLPL